MAEAPFNPESECLRIEACRQRIASLTDENNALAKECADYSWQVNDLRQRVAARDEEIRQLEKREKYTQFLEETIDRLREENGNLTSYVRQFKEYLATTWVGPGQSPYEQIVRLTAERDALARQLADKEAHDG